MLPKVSETNTSSASLPHTGLNAPNKAESALGLLGLAGVMGSLFTILKRK